eukprot:GHVQ01020860.1.p1 GENE.GHVQ01020860.1~~GHVQ01020860.1.p1  ORF type:complete len:499 (-),score=87.11 GHVQ01020860.1:496-1992(-)
MGCVCGKDGGRVSHDIRQDYRIGRLLGSGAFGQVRECTKRSSMEVRAVKIMEKRSTQKGHWSNESIFRREVAYLAALEHENIVKYYDFYEDRHFLYSVMERCDGGALFDSILRRKYFNEEAASLLCRQMLDALIHIHRSSIVHRDVKAENFLFKNNFPSSTLILIDFGMSAKCSDSQPLLEVCGSPQYLSPELIRRSYGTPADMWALGVLVYLMIYGRYPFDGADTSAIVKEVLTKDVQWESSYVRVSSLAIDFLKGLLDRDPVKRLTAIEARLHRWVEEKTPEKEAATIPQDVLRSAHRKITMRKTQPAEAVEAHRNELLLKLDNDFKKGYGTGGVHLSSLSAPRKRPEFSRRDKRVTTTPSRMSNMSELDVIRRSQLSVLSSEGDTPLSPPCHTPLSTNTPHTYHTPSCHRPLLTQTSSRCLPPASVDDKECKQQDCSCTLSTAGMHTGMSEGGEVGAGTEGKGLDAREERWTRGDGGDVDRERRMSVWGGGHRRP